MTIIVEDPPWGQPSHPNLIKVHRAPGSYRSYATSLVSLPDGSFFTPITNHFFIPERTWPSIEAPNSRHMDLNSDLFYLNYSCTPGLEKDMTKMEARVSRYRDLQEGDLLTFFYPSTKWHMVQPFERFCNEEVCLSKVVRSGDLERAKRRGYWLNPHIKERLKKEHRKDAGKETVTVNEKEIGKIPRNLDGQIAPKPWAKLTRHDLGHKAVIHLQCQIAWIKIIPSITGSKSPSI